MDGEASGRQDQLGSCCGHPGGRPWQHSDRQNWREHWQDLGMEWLPKEWMLIGRRMGHEGPGAFSWGTWVMVEPSLELGTTGGGAGLVGKEMSSFWGDYVRGSRGLTSNRPLDGGVWCQWSGLGWGQSCGSHQHGTHPCGPAYFWFSPQAGPAQPGEGWSCLGCGHSHLCLPGVCVWAPVCTCE